MEPSSPSELLVNYQSTMQEKARSVILKMSCSTNTSETSLQPDVETTVEVHYRNPILGLLTLKDLENLAVGLVSQFGAYTSAVS